MKGLVAAAAIAAVFVPATPARAGSARARRGGAGDEAAARAAAKRGAEWLAGRQAADGSGLGGFGLTALAAGGLHPADVRVGDGPSAQARAQADWAASGAGPRGTDLARSLLAAHAAGIDPTLITAERNFVAETLALFDGRRLYDPGAASSLSDDIFGTLGLAAADAPQPLLDALATFLRSQQTATGGWNFTEGAANASLDMTGAGVGALCAAGAPVSDPAVAKALTFLRERQDPLTAGWGANSDTAGWVVSGLRTCGVDPKQWIRNGLDPLDDLMSRQLPSGGFRWRDTDTTENALATLDSVRPLGGAGFTADPPARAGGAPRLLAPPEVADGTEVPVGVVVDYGVAVRACSVRARTGSPDRDGRRDRAVRERVGQRHVVDLAPRRLRRRAGRRRRHAPSRHAGSRAHRARGGARRRAGRGSERADHRRGAPGRAARDHGVRRRAHRRRPRLGPALPAGPRERPARPPRRVRRRADDAAGPAARAEGRPGALPDPGGRRAARGDGDAESVPPRGLRPRGGCPSDLS